MKLRNLLIISVFLHVCFFTAVLLFSEILSRGKSETSYETLFSVSIAPGDKLTNQDIFAQREQNVPGPASGALLSEAIPDVKSDVLFEADSGDADKFSVRENISGGAFHKDRKKDEVNGVEFLYTEESTVNISHNILSSENGLKTEGESKRGRLPDSIIEIIRNSIERAKTYPVLARRRGIEGTVNISFRIGTKGEPNNIKVLKGSGYNILDNAAFNIIKKAAPFPYIDTPVEIPVVYRLK